MPFSAAGLRTHLLGMEAGRRIQDVAALFLLAAIVPSGGAALISLFPPLFFRDGHDTLTAHFIITLLLYFVFKGEKRYTYPAIAAMCALAVSIHFYFLIYALLVTPTKVFYEPGSIARECAGLFSGLGSISFAPWP